MARNPTAPLSNYELSSLRKIDFEGEHTLPSAHREIFLSMQLIVIGEDGRPVITQLGRDRLTKAETMARAEARVVLFKTSAALNR